MEDEVKGHLAVVHRLVKNVYCITGDYSSTHPAKSHFLSSFPLFFIFSAVHVYVFPAFIKLLTTTILSSH